MRDDSPEIDRYLEQADKWRGEMRQLRRIVLDCGLAEGLKWGKPCYSFEQGNVAIIQPFKDRCALMFFKGALLEDPEGLLDRPGPNSRAARRIEFTGVDEVVEKEDRLRGFIADAIEIEKAGRKVEAKTGSEPIPDELEDAFGEVPGLEKAFRELTPGRQRGYILHVSGAKRSTTRKSRIDKCVPRILEGKGLRD